MLAAPTPRLLCRSGAPQQFAQTALTGILHRTIWLIAMQLTVSYLKKPSCGLPCLACSVPLPILTDTPGMSVCAAKHCNLSE